MAHCKALAGTQTFVAPPTSSLHCSVPDSSQQRILKTSPAFYPNTLCLLRSCSKSSPSASSQLQWGSSEHGHGQTQALNCTYHQLQTRSRSGGSISCLQSSNESERGGGKGGEEEEGSRFEVEDCKSEHFSPLKASLEGDLGKIFIGNLPNHIKKDAVKTFFTQFGPVRDLIFIRSHTDPEKNRGYCFLFFGGPDPNAAAIRAAEFDGVEFHEKMLRVKLDDGRRERDRREERDRWVESGKVNCEVLKHRDVVAILENFVQDPEAGRT